MTQPESVEPAAVPVVGIGASAGGLEALSQLLHGLDPALPFAYVVLQHVSPTHRSLLPEILGRDTALQVRAMEDGEAPRAGVVHVVPPNVNAFLREGRFSLVAAKPEVVPKPSVNDFFISLAAEAGDEAIGIVLSGTGSDGTAGLRTILAAGGVTLVQEPGSAKYSGMPHSAIEAGVADFIIVPQQMAAKLAELASLHEQARTQVSEEVPPVLFEKLKVRREIDFSGYKSSTLTRRVRRRMMATGTRTIAAYLELIEERPEELDTLARDILISVAAFFRDASAFEALRPTGLLFLGRSESVGASESMFKALDRRERLFGKQGEQQPLPTSSPLPRQVQREPQRRQNRAVQQLLDGVMTHLNATVALCDHAGQILHTAGQVERLFHFPAATLRSVWPK